MLEHIKNYREALAARQTALVQERDRKVQEFNSWLQKQDIAIIETTGAINAIDEMVAMAPKEE